jgi:hypothetical protein
MRGANSSTVQLSLQCRQHHPDRFYFWAIKRSSQLQRRGFWGNHEARNASILGLDDETLAYRPLRHVGSQILAIGPRFQPIVVVGTENVAVLTGWEDVVPCTAQNQRQRHQNIQRSHLRVLRQSHPPSSATRIAMKGPSQTGTYRSSSRSPQRLPCCRHRL